MHRAAFAIALAVVPFTAHAFDKTLAVQGTLRTAGGQPATDGSYGATLVVYDGPGAGAAKLYSEAHPAIDVQGGIFGVVLGSVDPGVNPLPPALFFDHEALFVGVKVGDEPELMRVAVRPVPWAIRASRADDLACSGCIGAGHIAPSVLAPYATIASLKAVATSGLYGDLAGIPDLTVYAKTADLGDIYATIADVGAAYVARTGDSMTGPLALVGANLAAPLVVGDGGALGRLLQRSDGAVALSRGGGWDGGWIPDSAGGEVTALVLDAAGRARLEVGALSRPLGAVQVVEAALAPGESIDLPHGRSTLDVVATAWIQRDGAWHAVSAASGEGLAGDAEHYVHWSLNGCDGEDGSGSGYDGTVVGPLACVDGKAGKAFSWDGAAFRNVTLKLDAKLAGLSKKHTFAMWMYRATHNKTMHAFSYDDGSNNHLIAVDTSGNIGLTWNHTGVTVAGSVPLQTWTHLASTYDGTTLRVYVNGTQTHASSQANLTIGAGNCILLGEDADANCAGGNDADVWKGNLDEFHVFGRALTPAEVVRVMNDDLAGGGSDAEVTLVDKGTVRLTSRRVETSSFRLVVMVP